MRVFLIASVFALTSISSQATVFKASTIVKLKNDSAEPIVAVVTHTECKISSAILAGLKSAVKVALTALAELAKAKASEEAPDAEATEKTPSLAGTAAKTTGKAVLASADDIFNAIKDENSNICGSQTIEAGKTWDYKRVSSGFWKGQTVVIYDGAGEQLSSTKDVKKNSSATWNGTSLVYVKK